MRGAAVLATLLEVVGFVLVVAAAYLVSVPLALLVAGLGLLIAAGTLDTRGAEPRRRLRRRARTQ